MTECTKCQEATKELRKTSYELAFKFRLAQLTTAEVNVVGLDKFLDIVEKTADRVLPELEQFINN